MATHPPGGGGVKKGVGEDEGGGVDVGVVLAMRSGLVAMIVGARVAAGTGGAVAFGPINRVAVAGTINFDASRGAALQATNAQKHANIAARASIFDAAANSCDNREL